MFLIQPRLLTGNVTLFHETLYFLRDDTTSPRLADIILYTMGCPRLELAQFSQTARDGGGRGPTKQTSEHPSACYLLHLQSYHPHRNSSLNVTGKINHLFLDQ